MSEPVVHAMPDPITGPLPCCGRYQVNLPAIDKLALVPEAVTCGKPMPDTPTLTAAQKAELTNWAARRSRPGTGGDPDELNELVAGWLAEAREIAWDEGHDEARHGTDVEDNPYRSTP